MKKIKMMALCIVAIFIASCSSSSNDDPEIDSDNVRAFIEGVLNGAKHRVNTSSGVSYHFYAEINQSSSNGNIRRTVRLKFPFGQSFVGDGVELYFTNPVKGKNKAESFIIAFENINGEIVTKKISNRVDVDVTLGDFRIQEGDLDLNIEGKFSGSYISDSGDKYNLEDMNFGFTKLAPAFDPF